MILYHLGPHVKHLVTLSVSGPDHTKFAILSVSYMVRSEDKAPAGNWVLYLQNPNHRDNR